jgi:hypothetical protein
LVLSELGPDSHHVEGCGDRPDHDEAEDAHELKEHPCEFALICGLPTTVRRHRRVQRAPDGDEDETKYEENDHEFGAAGEVHRFSISGESEALKGPRAENPVQEGLCGHNQKSTSFFPGG